MSMEAGKILRHYLVDTLRFFKSITYDQGKEVSNYQEIDEHFGTSSYFCHAGCPGERGLNEQTNGLLRQFESIAKRMIKYLLFARSHEIWQREIL